MTDLQPAEAPKRASPQNPNMGRTPKPTAIHEINGAFDHNPQRRDAREHEPVPSGPLGDPPACLDETEAAIWHELEGMVPAGVLTNADRLLLEITCRLMKVERKGGRHIPKNEGQVFEPMKSSERSQLIQCLSRMGLTPADRTRLIAPTSGKTKDPFAALAANPRRQ